jgi:hypothetical protein
MTTKITADNIEQATLDNLGSGPIIANVQIANSSYSVLDDTAVNTDGGYIIINGSKFESNVNVLIDGTAATSVTYVSENQIRAQVGAATAGSKIVYLVNTDTGATAIRINGLTYSGVPSWSTDSALAEGAVDEAISIQLSATADSNVSYQLQTGSTLPTGLTLAANGLLTGTVTGVEDETTYNFIVEAIDAENQESPRSFSITITAGDANINSVVLALNADSNTFITDASTNSSTITPNGDTRPSAFSPYNTSWSNYFDTGATRLTLSDTSSISGVGANNFSIECWVYALRRTNTFVQGLVSYGTAGSTTGSQYLSVEINGSGYLGVAYATGASLALIDPNLFLINQWVHVVVCRSGSTLSLFINGTRVATTQTSSTVGSTGDTLVIGGQWYANADTRQINGYMSDVRIVNGSSAYDATQSSLTVPTTPLTAISGTSLLTCQSNRFIDNSTNNFTITRNGDVKVTSFAPFTETDATTGSGYFDGTGDYLAVPDDVSLDGFTGDFTVEFWVNFTSVAAGTPLSKGWNGSTFSPYLFLLSSGNLIFYASSSGSWDIASGLPLITSVQSNVWYHVAVSRSGNTLNRFVNGALIGSTTTTATFLNSPDALSIGSSTGGYNPMTGYVSSVRVVKGTAVYTSAFTPPTSPLTAIANTSLLTLQNRISYNNSQPIDESGVKNIVTRVGNASVGSYTPHTPAGWSAYFDGVGDVLIIPDNENLDFGTGDFTVELWARFDNITNDRGFIGSTSTGGYDFCWRTSTGLNIGRVNAAFDNTFAWTPTVGVWYHIAYCRSGTSLRVFVNGEQIGSTATNSFTYNCQTNFVVGGSTGGDRLFLGNLSNIRLIKGTALYTANFTPSTTPLEPVANTSLLTLRGPSFTDDGPNRFDITRNGDTRITPFSPFKTHTIVPDSHSVFFDGTDDHFTIADSESLRLGSGNFTAEGWFYPTKSGTVVCFYTKGVNTTGGIILGVSTQQILLRHTGSTDTYASVSISGWNHIAWVRNGNTISIYVNGVAQSVVNSTVGFNQNDTSTAFIGSGTNIGSATNRYGGYASNFRIVKGTALYTENFTPSTTPLTTTSQGALASEVELLTCQSSTFVDNSDNNFTLTVVNQPQPTKFNPFGETVTTGVQYSPASHGGSYYFDGTGDYVSLTPFDNSYFIDPFNTGKLTTIECWLYLNALTSPRSCLFAHWTGSVGWTVDVDTNGNLFFTNGGAGTGVTLSTKIQIKQWQHLALSFNGTTTTVYLNGTSVGSIGLQNPGNPTTNFVIGCRSDGTLPTNGYISNFIFNRYTKYTSNFIPPQFISYDSRAVVVLNGTNAAIADGVGKNVLETVGNARIINGTKKYGTGSMYFDGTGDYLFISGTINNSLGSGDFTVEGWVYLSGTTGQGSLGEQGIIGSGVTTASRWVLRLQGTSTKFFSCWLNTPNNNMVGSTAVSQNTWYHIALVRSGSSTNNIKFYLNGVLESQRTNTYGVPIDNLVIGRTYTNLNGEYWNGYIDDLRITKDIARYTSNFTPPTSSFKLK